LQLLQRDELEDAFHHKATGSGRDGVLLIKVQEGRALNPLLGDVWKFIVELDNCFLIDESRSRSSK
jgi:hypothetical protein